MQEYHMLTEENISAVNSAQGDLSAVAAIGARSSRGKFDIKILGYTIVRFSLSRT